MEFLLHLPQDIDKDGALWQIWNSFCQKVTFFQSTEFLGPELSGVSSLLLFAARDQISSICSSLIIYDLDLPKLNSILQVVEQMCLPYFILMFERFRYFNLKRDLSESLDDFFNVLRKQAEMCEFGNQEEIIMKNALCSSLKSESNIQHLSNEDGLLHNDIKAGYSGAKRHNKTEDNQVDNAVSNLNINRATKDTNCEIFGLSGNDKLEPVNKNTSSSNELNASIDGTDCCFSYHGNRHKISIDKRKIGRPAKLNTLKTKKKPKVNRTEELISLPVEDLEIETNFANFENNEDTFLELCTKTGSACNKKLTDTNSTEENIVILKKFPCCLCTKAFAGQNCMKKHLVLKHKDCTVFPCKVCASVFQNVEEYLLHYKNEHFVKQQKPQSICAPAVKLNIKENMRFHCSLCRRMFVKEGYLRRHMQYSHAKSYLCWNCGESFQNLPDYKQHCEKHGVTGRFTCDLCHRQHHSVFKLIGHLKHHLMPQNKCEICGVVFIKSESLARHIEKHVEEPAHKCKVCGKNFVIEARLQYHMRTHSGEKRFTCELCGKMYTQKINLIYHKRWHTGEQPFECEICGKRTRSSGDLSKHKRKHSDKYTYVCEVCGRGFNYSSALVKHRMGHTGKRSYACDVCGRTYIYRDGLRDHIKASRCPGRRSESGYNRTPRATKLLQFEVSSNPLDARSKVYGPIHSQKASDTDLKESQAWHCMIRNNEAEGGTSMLVPSFY